MKACYNQNYIQVMTHQDGLAQAGKVLLYCRKKLPSFLSAETAVKDQNNTTWSIMYHVVHHQVVEPFALSKASGSEYRYMSLRLSVLLKDASRSVLASDILHNVMPS